MNWFSNIFFGITLSSIVVGCSDTGERSEARGDAAIKAHDPVTAARFYADSAAKSEMNLSVYVKLASSAIAAGNLSAAKEAVAKAGEIDPNGAEVILAKAHIAYLERDYATAIKSFVSIADTKSIPPSVRSQAMAGAAVAELAAGRISASRIWLWKALRLDRRSAVVWYHLGYLSRNTYHATAAAIEQFEMAARLDGNSPRARDIRKTVLPALRESIRIRSAETKGALRRDPNASAILVSEGEKAVSRQHFKLAANKFAQAYEKDPFSYAAAWNHAKSLMRANNSNVAKTLAVFRSAEDAKPTSQLVYRTAARYALKNGHVADAIAILNRALAHDFEDKETLDLFIQALGKTDKANESAGYKAFRGQL